MIASLKILAIHIIMNLPLLSITNKLKRWLLIKQGAKIGANPTFYPGVWISGASGLVAGDNVDFSKDVIITAAGGVSIGDRVLIGYRTIILSGNHKIPPKPQRIFGSGHELAPMRIEKDVWICTGVTILPGVTIGEGAVIASGAVVTKNVEPFTIVGGVPARLIRRRI